MHSLSTPVIRPSVAEDSPPRYEALPPWLVSMLFHMMGVILLGLLTISTNPGNNLSLLFLPAENSRNSEVPDEGLVDLDIAIEADPSSFSTVVDVAAPIAVNEMLTSLDSDWQELISTAGGEFSLVPGMGDGALGEVAGTRGKNGTTSLFGLAGEGGKFVYVFDRSASMNSVLTLYSEGRAMGMVTPLECAKVELARSLEALTAANEFQIVFYNHGVEVFSDRHYAGSLFAATDEHKRRANEFIREMPGAGFTNHLIALETALNLEPDVIFLLTDGEAKDDLHPDVVRRMAKFCQQKNIMINVVHFSNFPRTNCTLIPLAEKTGGRHVFLSLESLAKTMINPMAL